MPRKPKSPPAELPAIPLELLEQFGNGPMTAEAISAATLAFKNALIERALGGKMSHHLDDKIVAMYARGMTVRKIQGFLRDQYATEVSPDFISSVTDEVMAEVTSWQARPLEPMYPIVFFDALRVKIAKMPW